MASSRRRPSDPSAKADLPAGPSTVEAALAARVFELFDKVLKKFEARVEDPDYRPTPSDIVGVAQALKAAVEVASAVPSVMARVDALKTELETIQNKLLGLLTSGE